MKAPSRPPMIHEIMIVVVSNPNVHGSESPMISRTDRG
jgi:hypothetical protein